MKYPVKVKFEGKEMTGNYTLNELISKLEEILHGTNYTKEEKER